jgi:hypothetical protein
MTGNMNYTTLPSWGPEKTPATVKSLMIFTCVAAIFSVALQSFLAFFDIFPGPQDYLSLSWWGLSHWYVWQPLSFIFVQDAPWGLSFSFFVSLIFHLVILWSIGSAVLEIISPPSFLRLYLIGTMVAGGLTLLSMLVTGHYEMLTGMSGALVILLTVWSMAFPETEVLLFFLVPVKAKWIVLSILGVIILNALIHLELTSFFLYFFSVLVGYVYSVAIHSWYSPFPVTLFFDLWLTRVASFLRRHNPLPKKKVKDVKDSEVKIIDLTSNQHIDDDDAFVDAMLSKISRRGEESLSRSERNRLNEISKRKMQDN